MIVYIATGGNKCEGYNIVGVFESPESAKNAALSQMCCFEGGWIPDGENYWENGCYFVAIETHETRP